jgi:hypothetical protein
MTHWLQIGGMKVSQKAEDRQWNNLQQYLSDYSESKATVYYKETGDIFCRIVKLECNQNYRDLDLYCNGGDGSVRHLDYKPKDLALSKLQLDYFVNRSKREAV